MAAAISRNSDALARCGWGRRRGSPPWSCRRERPSQATLAGERRRVRWNTCRPSVRRTRPAQVSMRLNAGRTPMACRRRRDLPPRSGRSAGPTDGPRKPIALRPRNAAAGRGQALAGDPPPSVSTIPRISLRNTDRKWQEGVDSPHRKKPSRMALRYLEQAVGRGETPSAARTASLVVALAEPFDRYLVEASEAPIRASAAPSAGFSLEGAARIAINLTDRLHRGW